MTRRLFATAVAALSLGVAVAAPVPKTPPPPAPKASATAQLSTAKMNGEYIQITQSVTVTEYISVNEVIEQNGQNVTITKAVPRQRQVESTYQMTVKGTKASTAGGKEISEEDLPKKLGEGVSVVQVPAGFDPEWKKLFADDVIFLEPIGNGPGGRAVMPALPGGVVVQPARLQAVPVQIAPPLPIEKK